mmetsp:Transcript_46367/g.110412  ORF Transcript_46367/g.110412 Transcript_46367/m.110412 type:complete len:572 (-) Transcript_46367:20-1735(-)
MQFCRGDSTLSSLRVPLCQAACLAPGEEEGEVDPEGLTAKASPIEKLVRANSGKAIARGKELGATSSMESLRSTNSSRNGLTKAQARSMSTQPADTDEADLPQQSSCLGVCGGVDPDSMDLEGDEKAMQASSSSSKKPLTEASAARAIQTSWRKRYGDSHIHRKGRLRTFWSRIRQAEREFEEEVEEYLEDKRLRAMNRIRRISTPVVRTLFASIRDLVRVQSTADPHLPRRLKPVLHDVTGSIMDDLEVEVDLTLRSATMVPSKKQLTKALDAVPSECRNTKHLRIFMRIRAFVLFHWLPYNLSVFGKLKDKYYLALALIAMWPTPLVRVVFYGIILVMLVCPWPPDEYQLIGYILSFKGSQFWTTGVVSLLFIAFEYLTCYLFSGDQVRECINKSGPGASSSFTKLTADLLGTVVLVWVAFLMLPYSKRRYAFHVVEKDHQELEKRFSRGGRLYRLLKYDMVSFGLCSLAMVLLYAADVYENAAPQDLSLHRKELIYWCRVLYGLSSLPFSLFILPVVGRFLTHVDTTGFDNEGNVRVFEYSEEDPVNDLKCQIIYGAPCAQVAAAGLQ